MKNLHLLLLSIGLLALAAPAQADGPDSATVKAVIHGLKNTSGKLLCAIYSNAQGWPDKGGVSRQAQSIAGKDATCVFSGLKPGTYAVTVLHDENNNGAMDYGTFGAPAEGWGSSNNITHTFSGPSFEESSFALSAGASMVVAIEIHN
ncbi:MAG: DUF2141 domain-containing protein [Myxococcota bacterium]